MTPHGSHSTYGNYRCRCRPCTDAHTAYIRRRRAERAAMPMPASVEHGLPSTYANWRCRCWKCKTAHWVQRTIQVDRRKVAS